MTAVDIAAFLETSRRDSDELGLLVDIISTSTEGALYWELDPPVDTRDSVDEQFQAICERLRVRYCNSDYAQMMGYDDPEELIGRHIEEFLDHLNLKDKIRELVETDYQLTESHFPYEDASGKRIVHSVLTHSLMKGHLLVGIWNSLSDDTERFKREQDLEISRQLLADSQTMARIGSWSSNMKGDFDFQSEQVAVLLDLPPTRHYTFEEILQRAHPADREKLMAGRAFAETTDETQTIEFRVIHDDGSIHHLRTVARTSFNHKGEPVRWVGSLQDISQDKLLQESRRAQYLDLPDPMFTIEMDQPINTELPVEEQTQRLASSGRVVDCNHALALALDCERSDLMGQPASFLEAIWSLHGQRFCEDDYRLNKRLIKFEGGPASAGARWIQLDASGTREDGLLTRVWGSFRDVTEQVQVRTQLQEMVKSRTEALSEEVELRRRDAETLRRQAVIVSQMSEAVIVWDLDMHVTDWNEGAEKVFGYSRAEMIGQRTRHIRPQQGLPEESLSRDALIELIRERDGWQGELPFQHKDGHEVICETSFAALRDERGEIVSMIEVNRDITERKAAEAQVAAAREAAEQANTAKSVFIRGLSHELRTPLNAILGFGQLIERIPNQPLVTQQKAYVDHIRAGGEHLLELVNQVLDLAKIEAGEVCLCIDQILPATVAEDCLQMVTPQAQERKINIDRNYASERRVFADDTRLKQVLFNLLSNAVKYNREGGDLQVDISDSGAERVRISVSDTGQGVPEERMHELFEPFNRLGITDVNIEGTGLGLPITQQLVTAMNGELGVDSEEGVGSTFWVELPTAP